ncbi:hypothetical protein FPZ12_002105 [Amycolatopsis acidicola]|uniref:Uncharacterized protein n=1 Tax=Amycolatopsis acidicola TaxID=2596893 RepID=A0A5N0VKY8_9PSEU|nr:hypothetical protein [Amycolatopsis acidicola]KAA9166378.1 hypothetical protein FPZ12_002105 [Amycolatopsis acidicola]
MSQTRRALHGVAELVLAGPQYRAAGTLRLRVTPGGFGTTRDPRLMVVVDQLVAGERRVPLDGTTCAHLHPDAGAPAGLYDDGSGLTPDEKLSVDPAEARAIMAAFSDGDTALRLFSPDTEPVLWPEHFDLASTVGEVNYGVSPGDGYLPEPYAYVGPHQPRQGEFWNAPFGAAAPLSELDGVEAILRFFRRGRDES